jgi:hypothetical protein
MPFEKKKTFFPLYSTLWLTAKLKRSKPILLSFCCTALRFCEKIWLVIFTERQAINRSIKKTRALSLSGDCLAEALPLLVPSNGQQCYQLFDLN